MHSPSPRRFLVVIGAALALACVAGCASNPIATAQTVDQKAFATYGELVILEERGAALMKPGVGTPTAVRTAIKSADAVAKPALDTLYAALQAYELVAHPPASGTPAAGNPATLADTQAKLIQATALAVTSVANFQRAITTAPGAP